MGSRESSPAFSLNVDGVKLLRSAAFCLTVLGVSIPAYGSHEEMSHDERDFVTALNELKSLARQGDVSAQVKLGDRYDTGRGVRQDHKEAFKWYLAAAERGHAAGYTAMGVMYDGGYGVSQNYEKAVHCYRIAAKQGDALSQYFLGVSYMKGEGLPQDNIRAYMWFEIAASQGLNYAIQDRAIIGNQMSSDQIAEAKQLARR